MYHSSMIYEGRLYTLGGRTDDASVYADTWYRDDNLPIAKFTKVPKSRSSDHEFRFVSADGNVMGLPYVSCILVYSLCLSLPLRL